MTTLYVLAIVYVLFTMLMGIHSNCIDSPTNEGYTSRTIFTALSIFADMCMIIILIIACLELEHPCIDTIEVYRGNTELQINQTTVNGEVIHQDTIVIFKKSK